MKNMKKMLGFLALGLFAMMFTSCKAKIGGGEFSIFWQILAIFMWLAEISQSEYLLPKKIKFFRGLINFILIILFIAGITLPFIWCPIPSIPKITYFRSTLKISSINVSTKDLRKFRFFLLILNFAEQ